MKCYYKIQLPGGGFVRIPSSVDLLTPSDDLSEKIEEFYSSPNIENFNTDLREVYSHRFDKNFSSKFIPEFQKKYPEEYEKYESLIEYFNMENLGMTREEIGKQIRTSDMSTIVDNINNKLMESLTPENLEIAVKKWCYYELSGKKKLEKGEISPASLAEFLKFASQKITPEYFNDLPLLNIVGKTSLKNEIENLNNTINSLEDEFGLSASIQKNVKEVLNSVQTDENKRKEIFYGISRTGSENDTLVVRSSKESSGFIFYNNNNELSLFLGVFKYIASEIEWTPELTSQLKEIISDWNKTAETKINLTNFNAVDFFVGNFVNKESGKKEKLKPGEKRNVEFKDGKFHRLLSNFSQTHINRIVDLVSANAKIDKKGKFQEASKRVFKWIDPKKYGNAIFSKERLASSEYDTQTLKNIEYKKDLIARKYGIYNTSENRDMHYAPSIILREKGPDAIENAYLKIKENFELGKDIIKVPSSKDPKFDKYVIATKITPQKDGLLIKGITYNYGITEEETYFIKLKKDDDIDSQISIEYRKFETENDPYVTDAPGILKDASLIKGKDDSPLEMKIVKQYIQVGSLIKYKNSKGVLISDTVKGVFPGYITTIKSRFPIKYDKVIEFNTLKLSESDLKDWKDEDFSKNPHLHITGKNAISLPTKGDIVKFKENGIVRINKVVHSNKTDVYILVKPKESSPYIEKISRKNISEALINYDFIELSNEIDEADNDLNNIFLDKSIRENKYSYSHNLKEAKVGDIVVRISDDSSKNSYYKLIDKIDENTWKVVERIGLELDAYSASTLNVDDKSLGLLTTRDISSVYSLDIDRVNKRKIYTSNTDDETDVVYLMLKNTTPDQVVLFDSLHFNVGMVIDRDHYLKNLDKYTLYDDVTDQAKKLISKKLNVPIKGIKFKTLEGNVQEKFIDELFRINHFDSLPKEDKIAGLQIGGYVRLSGQKLGKKIFRISENFDDSVMLEYSVLSPKGETKTIKTKMSKNELVDNIGAYYLIKGNSKIQPLVKKVSSMVKQDNRTKEDVREAFVYGIQQTFKNAGISIAVKVVPAEGNFLMNDKTRQKAKIQNGDILINKDDSTEVDVVHEFLHVFMIGLKYSDNGAKSYTDLLLDFWKTELKSDPKYDNLDKLEEAFVEKLSEVLAGTEDLEFNSVSKIEDALKQAMNTLGLNSDNLRSYDLYTIMNTELKELIGATRTNKNYSNLLVFEANFRKWIEDSIDNDKLKINCK